MLRFGLVDWGFKVLEMGDDFGEFCLTVGVGAGASSDGVFIDILGPVNPGPATAPFTAICHLSCHSSSVSC